jgi:signal peptidase II
MNFGLAGEATNSRQFLLAALSVLICLGVLIWGVISTSKWAVIIASLLAGGGLANAYERVAYGGVFDYLNVSFTFFANPYSFNLADVYIFIGAVMFIFRPQNKDYE